MTFSFPTITIHHISAPPLDLMCIPFFTIIIVWCFQKTVGGISAKKKDAGKEANAEEKTKKKISLFFHCLFFLPTSKCSSVPPTSQIAAWILITGRWAWVFSIYQYIATWCVVGMLITRIPLRRLLQNYHYHFHTVSPVYLLKFGQMEQAHVYS